MKLEWQWPAVVVFSVVFATIGALVYFGKVPADGLLMLLAWLIPSPMQRKLPEQS